MSDATFTFTDIMDPSAAAVDATTPDAINDSGAVTGYYFDGSVYTGFIESNGSYTTLIDPAVGTGGSTIPIGINDSGVVAGYDYNGTLSEGFIYANGSFTAIIDPSQASSGETIPDAINASGVVAGYYEDNTSVEGFIYANGTFDNIRDPLQSATGGNTVPVAINAAGVVTGTYFNGMTYEGFIYSNGTFTNIVDPLQSKSGSTVPVAINDSGVIIGYYDTATDSQGFIYSNGTFTNLADPSATADGDTIPAAINAAGDVTGYYDNGTNDVGFIYSNGTFTNFVDPSAAAGALTYPTGINDAGVVTGYYTNAQYEQVGFVAEMTCFCVGTRIRTIHGDVAVERLAVGDLVITAAGVAQVRWIGRRAFAARFAQANPAIWPVRIAAGALAPNVPKRDLFVSPNHALFLGEALIPAGCLVNGTTITRAAPEDELAYFHIELATHSVIFAEDAPAETYLETGGRAMFHNAATAPDAVVSAPFARLLESGAVVEAVRNRLAARASGMGFVAAPAASLRLTRGACRMVLEAGVTALTLRSATGFAPGDRRQLGALIRGITVDGVALDLAGRECQRGFHAPERHGKNTVRWTNGDAVLAIPPSGQTRVIEIRVAAVMERETDAEAA